jgi:ribosomal protein S18 acetylase RimI-like enzyme
VDLHAPSGAPALDLQLQQYLRGAAARDRDVERVGPFTATFDRDDANPYLNYAIPDDGARPTAQQVAALVATYRARGRVPRLEYLPTAAPAVEAALLAGGFVVEGRLPGMTCVPGAVVDLAPAGAVTIAVPQTDADWRGMSVAQHAAFDLAADAEAVSADEVARQRARLAAGGHALLARDEQTGAVVGGGVATVPGDGVTEIAGIGVLESHRRRGIAGAITSGLTRAAFAAGLTTVWLTPGDHGAHRVYARAGFADAKVILHVSAPAA